MNEEQDLKAKALAEKVMEFNFGSMAVFFSHLKDRLIEESKKSDEWLSLELRNVAFSMVLASQAMDHVAEECVRLNSEDEAMEAESGTVYIEPECEKCGRVYCDHENKY